MINEAYELVKEFQQKANQPSSEFPLFLNKERCSIRCKWMKAELEEFEQGKDIYEQADAIIDLLYYALGALVEMGVAPDELFLLIHECNMKKLSNVICDEDGKILKPSGWCHPDRRIKAIIDLMNNTNC